MFMIADKFVGNLVKIKQFATVAGIFTGDQIDRFQSFDGAKRNVRQIADRRGKEVKRSNHWSILNQFTGKTKSPSFKARAFAKRDGFGSEGLI
jgi:hypothetical protein